MKKIGILFPLSGQPVKPGIFFEPKIKKSEPIDLFMV